MFRKRDPQHSLLETTNLLPAAKRQRLTETWAEAFRTRALPLIREEVFESYYCADNGAPNKPVQVVLGTLILKEMFNLTDAEALQQLEFNMLWHHALRLEPENAYLCQKTLHNFRARVMASDGGRLAFETVTAGMLEALGIRIGRQRLDSTQITSNFAKLSRLGLFCETIRVFLRKLENRHKRLAGRVPERVRRRYLKDDGRDNAYQDAASNDVHRRLRVCARDAWRLVQRFRGTQAAQLEGYAILRRLLEEQCETVETPQIADDDEDKDDEPAPIAPKEPKEISSSSLQTPHDPDVTYSGHKGKGYSVQIMETTSEDNEVEVITHVEVTPACESDVHHLVPALEATAAAGVQPTEVLADTTYGSVKNAIAAEARGVELVAPTPGPAKSVEVEAPKDTPTPVDFEIFPRTVEKPARCPADVEAIRQEIKPGNPQRFTADFPAAACNSCPLLQRCPTRANGDVRTLDVPLEATIREQRRLSERQPSFRERFRFRAGIEATNSELKRRYGLGRLRVRGRAAVRLAVMLKATACNVARMIRALLERTAPAEAVPA